MTRLVLAPAALAEIERLADFLLDTDPPTAAASGETLIDGLSILKQHPLIGRVVEHGFRELIISRGRTGYVSLYRFDPAADVATVLAIRHQREGGCQYGE